MSDDLEAERSALSTYIGGPADGEPVDLIGVLLPSQIRNGDWPGGYYQYDGARYRWVQG